MLTTTSEQRPPVNNDQLDPQTYQINTSFIGGTSEQRPPLNNGRFFGVPRVAVVHRFDCTFLYSTRPFSGKYESGSVGQISLDPKCHFSVDRKFC